MAHAFVTGVSARNPSATSRSVGSRRPALGFRRDGVCRARPPPRSQQVDPHIRYSGSPLAMSFGEVNHRKSSAIVDLSGDEAVVDPVQHPWIGVSPCCEVTWRTSSSRAHDEAEPAWCQVTITGPDPDQWVRWTASGPLSPHARAAFRASRGHRSISGRAERLGPAPARRAATSRPTSGGAVASGTSVPSGEAIDAARLGGSRSSDEGVVTPSGLGRRVPREDPPAEAGAFGPFPNGPG